MSPSIYVRMICRKSDLVKITSELVLDHDAFLGEDAPQGCVKLVGTEGGCAGYERFGELAQAGVPFITWHDGGPEFGPGIYASDGHVLMSCDTDTDDWPVIRVGSNGVPTKRVLREAKDFALHLRRVRKVLKHGV